GRVRSAPFRASPVARKADGARTGPLRRADPAGEGTGPRAGRRARAAALVAVGPGEGADRRRGDRRAAVCSDRTLAPAVPPRLRRLALRPRASGKLDSRRAHPLL